MTEISEEKSLAQLEMLVTYSLEEREAVERVLTTPEMRVAYKASDHLGYLVKTYAGPWFKARREVEGLAHCPLAS